MAINGRTRRVDVERVGGAFLVVIDGRRVTADVTAISGVWSLILGADPDRAGLRRSYEIAIVEQPPGSGSLAVHVDGRLVSVSVGTTRPASTRRRRDVGADGVASAATAGQVIAPMPGKVLKVLVRPGDTVAARQGVVVVEAMKMENELRAPRAGRVAEITVVEGASVEAGAILAVIE